MFNTAAGGHIMEKKEPEECEDMFESFAQAEQQQPSTRNSTPSARTHTSATRVVHQVTTETSMAAVLAAMVKEIKELKMSAMKCEVCRGGHDTIDCPVTQQEQVEFIGNRKPPLFNSGWRNYLNSNWRSGGNPPGFQNRQNQYGGEREAGQNSGSSAGEKRIVEMLANQTQLLAQLVKTDQETQYKLKEHDTLLRSQSSTETNPKATLKAVTTHSGKGGESEQTAAYDDDEPVNEEIEMEAPRGVHERQVPTSTVPNSEFPAEKEKSEGKKKTPDLKINLPFVEVLQHMPKYAKFLKDLLSNKKKLEDLSTVSLNERCSVVVQNKPPKKLADLGVFTIPCLFGGSTLHHALADLGASINLMPYSLFEKLGLGNPAPTHMSISLADRSVKYP
ncbi:hypothetical protein L1987_49271 [Smallanthus sonchifolius]|uniref:Uncharacterized protein n=1 Tax=Smallanthus sonchifolius TaxID=185202 RepID=A0ACB9FUS7_9ASTR|nr:hypothetical protein L1987_49271 [Smallanthus sonchifolius]